MTRPRVLKFCSGLRYEALAGVYANLGCDGAVGDDVFRDLVIARVVEPTSLLDVDRVLAELGRTCASLSTRKRTPAPRVGGWLPRPDRRGVLRSCPQLRGCQPGPL